MSSIYATILLLMGALFKPKGILLKWYFPRGLEKAVFSLSVTGTET